MAPRANHLPGVRVQVGDAGRLPVALQAFAQAVPAKPMAAAQPFVLHPRPQIRPPALPPVAQKLSQALASILKALLNDGALEALLQRLQQPTPQPVQPGPAFAAAAPARPMAPPRPGAMAALQAMQQQVLEHAQNPAFVPAQPARPTLPPRLGAMAVLQAIQQQGLQPAQTPAAVPAESARPGLPPRLEATAVSLASQQALQPVQSGKPGPLDGSAPAAPPASSAPAKTLPPEFAPLYQGLNLKVTPDTLPTFTNANLLGEASKLGSGAFNTVYAVQLQKPDGGKLDGVFKPLGNKENGWVAAKTGIPQDDPQIAMRNIATLAYAQKLGIGVIPDTQVAVLATDASGPKLGLVMERATGKAAAETDAAVFDRPDVRAEMTKLQLLDHLTGQGDRHGENFFIDTATNGRAKVTGIDNDQCFGAKLTDPNGIKYGRGADHRGFRGTSLPPVVDTEMAAKIKSITHDDIRAMLGDKLNGPEVEAAIARHEGVKAHIAKLEASNLVIRPEDWNKPHVTALLDSGNSYVGRERENALMRARFDGPNAAWA